MSHADSSKVAMAYAKSCSKQVRRRRHIGSPTACFRPREVRPGDLTRARRALARAPVSRRGYTFDRKALQSPPSVRRSPSPGARFPRPRSIGMRVEQTTARTASQPVAARDPVALPYSPSWIDRLMSWVQRLPLPYGTTYGILFVVEVVTLHVLSWVDGSLPLFHFHPLYLLFPLWLWGPLAIMTYLDEVALHALREFQPLLGKHEDEIPRLQYELATLPSRSVWISGLFWTGVFLVVMYVGFPVVVRQYSYGPIGVMTARISGVISFGTGIALYMTQSLFALGAFILPLWKVHQRLVTEKRRLLAGVNRRVEITIERLHQALDGDDLGRVKEIDTALGGLASERNVLSAIPTWPWSTATISGFVSALVLPIALFLIQLTLKNLLGV